MKYPKSALATLLLFMALLICACTSSDQVMKDRVDYEQMLPIPGPTEIKWSNLIPSSEKEGLRLVGSKFFNRAAYGVIFTDNDRKLVTFMRGPWATRAFIYQSLGIPSLAEGVSGKWGKASLKEPISRFERSYDGKYFTGTTGTGTQAIFDSRSERLVLSDSSILKDVICSSFAVSDNLLAVVVDGGYFSDYDQVLVLGGENWPTKLSTRIAKGTASINFSRYGKELIITSKAGEISYLNVETGAVQKGVQTGVSPILVKNHPDPNKISILDDHSSLVTIDLDSGKVLYTVQIPGEVLDFYFTAGGRVLIAGLNDGSILFWDVLRGATLSRYQLGGDLDGLNLSDSENMIATVSGSGEISLFTNAYSVGYSRALESMIDSRWKADDVRRLSAHSPADAGSELAKKMLMSSFTTVLGKPIVSDMHFDADNGRYMLSIIASKSSGWDFRQKLYIESSGIQASEEVIRSPEKLPVSVYFQVDPSGSILWKGAYIGFEGKLIKAKLIGSNEIVKINTQVASAIAFGLQIISSSEPQGSPIGVREKYSSGGGSFALVIGNNDYTQFPLLKTAVGDAEALGSLLSSEYGFTVKTLINATRADILKSLDEFRGSLNEEDRLLVFYAGHGYYDDATARGYWIPVNGTTDSSYDWISNADLTDRLKAIRANHVMVIADSCYSGTLTRGLSLSQKGDDYWNRIAQKRSRTVLTSGGLEPVLDAGAGSHSVFASALLDTLRDNSELMDGTSLFEKVRKKVIRNADQTPQYSDIRYAGHDGGDFIFQKQ